MKKAKTILSYILPVIFALGIIYSPLAVAMAVDVYDNESTTDVVFSSEQQEDEVEHYNYNDDSIQDANDVLSSFGTTRLTNMYLDQKGLDKTLAETGSIDTSKLYAKSLYGEENCSTFLNECDDIDYRSILAEGPILTEGQKLSISTVIDNIVKRDAEIKEKKRLEEEERLRIEAERKKAEEEQKKKEEMKRKALISRSGRNRQASVTTTHSGELVSIGKYRITGYDSCAKCNGSSSGKTACGTMITPGRTVAMKGYPYGTKIYIEGLGYRTVEDTGGFPKSVIDVAVENHSVADSITGYYQVYLVK